MIKTKDIQIGLKIKPKETIDGYLNTYRFTGVIVSKHKYYRNNVQFYRYRIQFDDSPKTVDATPNHIKEYFDYK